MSYQRITTVGETPALLLRQELLDQVGIHVGDTIDVSVIDGMLIVSPIDEIERAQKLEAIRQKVFERRKSAYQRLAS